MQFISEIYGTILHIPAPPQSWGFSYFHFHFFRLSWSDEFSGKTNLTWSNEIRTTERQVVKLSSEGSFDFQRKFGTTLWEAISVEFNIVVNGDLIGGLNPNFRTELDWTLGLEPLPAKVNFIYFILGMLSCLIYCSCLSVCQDNDHGCIF